MGTEARSIAYGFQEKRPADVLGLASGISGRAHRGKTIISVVISPTQPSVVALLASSDAYIAALYPAKSNHLTDVSSLVDPAVALVGIVEDGEVVSCGALVRQGNGIAELKRMFVSGRLRGRGHGKKILRALMTIADAEHLTVRLETGIWQPEAIAFTNRMALSIPSHLRHMHPIL